MGIEQKVAVITGAMHWRGPSSTHTAIVTTEWPRRARSMEPFRGDDVVAVSGDIADRKTAERETSQGVARFGPIDTLVNNASIFVTKSLTQYTGADYTAILGVNVTGFFHITQLAVVGMEKRGSGHIVQITTSLTDHAIAGVPAVLAAPTKGVLNAATQSLAMEYAKRGIRVSAATPRALRRQCIPSRIMRSSPSCIRSAV